MQYSDALKLAVALALLLVGPRTSCGNSPEIERIEVTPAAIELSGRNRQIQVIVTGFISDDEAVDLTHRPIPARIDDESVATIEHGLITAKRAGKTHLIVDGLKTTIPITVSDYDNYPAVHFASDILPMFAKRGCNSGGCHGKQAGQNGFKLSVFGFDPRADHDALAKEGRGRRVFPSSVERSLVYAKAVGQAAHGGGTRMPAESQDAELLREWLKQGMPWGSEGAPFVENISVWPTARTMAPHRNQQQLRVEATYSDGRIRDVTQAAVYTTNQPVIAECSVTGIVETGQVTGEAAITINYMGFVDVTRVVVLDRKTNVPVPPQWLPSKNPIDNFAWTKWQQLRIAPSDICDDATFLRRVKLKTTGTLPSPAEVVAFNEDSSPDKRQRVIDEALQSEDFVNYWSQRWSDILMVNSKSLGGRGAYTFQRWIHQQIRTNRPYDEWVSELIVASGNSGQVGPANFYRGQRTPEDATKAISQAFLGVRMDCAQCHHHPFEKWGQEDFYGLAGYFNGMTRQKLDDNRELVYHPGHKPIAIPVIDRPVDTRPLAGQPTQADSNSDPRPELAEWVTSADNPYFARLVANRIWKHLLGRGLVEPEDDFRATNPPTNPELLDHLAQQLVDDQFDLKKLMRHVMNSHTFQLSSVTNQSNESDGQTYSHYLVRRLPAEVLLDAICHVTGEPESYPGHPHGARAIEIWDNQLPSYFLDTFGRSLRESPCECGSSGEPTMTQALHLLNAPEIEAKIQAPSGRAEQLLNSKLDADELIREIVLVTVNRAANEKEIAAGRKVFANASRRQAIQDFMWVMMNSYDFLFVR
jgi:hypothetical protein